MQGTGTVQGSGTLQGTGTLPAHESMSHLSRKPVLEIAFDPKWRCNLSRENCHVQHYVTQLAARWNTGGIVGYERVIAEKMEDLVIAEKMEDFKISEASSVMRGNPVYYFNIPPKLNFLIVLNSLKTFGEILMPTKLSHNFSIQFLTNFSTRITAQLSILSLLMNLKCQ